MTRLLFIAASVLVMPLAALLFAQWPLREIVQAFTREANDTAQIFFALYMAFAVTAASRAGTHLAAARTTLSPRARAWALLACTGPWAAFMLWASTGTALAALRQAEHFPETFSQGYFVIRWALCLLAVLVLLDALVTLLRVPAGERTAP